MMRTIEVLIVIVILLGSFAVISTFTVLPAPRQVAPLNLRRLALTSLQTLDFDNDLSEAAFDTDNDTTWNHVQVALSAMLPADIIYNLTIYEINSNASETALYTRLKSVSNAESLGVASDSSQYSLSSSNVTFNIIPKKIGENGDGGTLYILNCSDANGWWITGYTAQSLASDLYKLLSPYFLRTIMVQNTTDLGKILSGTPLQNESIQSAVIINTCGEAVPIPTAYCNSTYSTDSYAPYCYFLGKKVQQYNWTWASIVGYPLYYVSNTGTFTGSSDQNGWGIYGMKRVGADSGAEGLTSFLLGLNNQTYIKNSTWITQEGLMVSLSSNASYYANYYGVYPYSSQTASRAVSSSIQGTYNLTAVFHVFDPAAGGWLAGSIFLHNNPNGDIGGKFIPIGLTRSADIRITALAILSFYHPSLYGFPEYTIYGTSRLAVLQLGLTGGAGA
jgi:hypothetical protein